MSYPFFAAKNAVASVAIAPMPEQRKRMEMEFAKRGYSDKDISDAIDYLMWDYNDGKLRMNISPYSGGMSSCRAPSVSFPDGRVLRVCGRPYISLRSDTPFILSVADLGHEITHAMDYVEEPVIEDTDDFSQYSLRSELRAYAVGYCLENYLLRVRNLRFRYPSVSTQVEEIRREINGPVTGERAFDVSDYLIKRIERAGLKVYIMLALQQEEAGNTENYLLFIVSCKGYSRIDSCILSYGYLDGFTRND